MKTKKNTRKIWAVVFMVALFLISSMVPVNAGLPDDRAMKITSGLSNVKTTSSDQNVFTKQDTSPFSAQPFSTPQSDSGNIQVQSSPRQYLQFKTINPPPFYYHNKYAVIIVGTFGNKQSYKWFSKDAQRQYNLTTQKLGFNKDNVYVLFTFLDNQSWVPDSSFNSSIVDCAATEENIKTVFNDLKNKMNPYGYDLLYVVVIAHGLDLGWYWGYKLGFNRDLWPNGHDTYFGITKPTGGSGEQEQETECLSDVDNYYSNQSAQIPQSIQSTYYVDNYDNCSKIDDRVFDHELNEYTRDIPARRIIFVLNPCMSGGFINDLSEKNRVIITASKEDEYANASFIGDFYYGLNGSGDNNGDNKISLAEVFDYTSNKVKEWLHNHPNEKPENPLLDDNGDGVGHNNTESGYDSTTEGKDGYVAARIYNLSYEEINYPPEIPNRPLPDYYATVYVISVGQKINLSAISSSNYDGDHIYYQWDWGDGTLSDWMGPYVYGMLLNHSWDGWGVYLVKVRAKDMYHAPSDWSIPLWIFVIPRHSNDFQQGNQSSILQGSQQSSPQIQNVVRRVKSNNN
jgi:hypothetical protein